MKITAILGAESIRLMRITPQRGQTLYGINLVRAFETRYGFLQGPKTLDDFDLTRGVTFLHGYFNEEVLIDRVQIFSNGLLVDCKGGTEVCDRIIDDIAMWAQIASDTSFEPPQPIKIYNSVLEVEMSGDFAARFEKFNSVGSEISNIIRSYGVDVKDYEVVSLHFWTQVQKPGPTPFKFERRSEVPFDSNLFWSGAPLSTGDHSRVLELIERIIS